MAFQIKDFATIILGMTNRAKALQSKITDFRVGSVARTLFESPAAEIDELYQQIWIGLKEAIPVAIYSTFSFDLIAATASTGTARITITSSSASTTISAGAVFTPADGSTSFTTAIDCVIAAGNTYIDCLVTAAESGDIGSLAAGTSFSVNPSISGLVSCVALSKFTAGTDIEEDSHRKARFAAYILTLNKGTTDALRYGLTLASVSDALGNITESAVYSQIVEPWLTDDTQPPALVNCYIHNGVDGASSDLITDAQKNIDGYYDSNGSRVTGWKAAGTKAVVQAAENVVTNITATISLSSGYVAATVITAIEAAWGEYIYALGIGDDLVRAELISSAMGIDGVANISLTAPLSDVSILNTQKAIAGAYSVSAG